MRDSLDAPRRRETQARGGPADAGEERRGPARGLGRNGGREEFGADERAKIRGGHLEL